MSEEMLRPGEENYVQDPTLAHDMALAEDPHRTEVLQTKQVAAELLGKIATAEGDADSTMQTTLTERFAASDKLDKLAKPGSALAAKRTSVELKDAYNNARKDVFSPGGVTAVEQRVDHKVAQGIARANQASQAVKAEQQINEIVKEREHNGYAYLPGER